MVKRSILLPVIGAILGVIFIASNSLAFIGDSATSGEAASVQSGFYECKRIKKGWEEKTLLMLVNQHAIEGQDLKATVVLVDGKENVLACGVTKLSAEDLDAVDICESLSKAGIHPPLAGVVEVVTEMVNPTSDQLEPQGGAYGWIKDMILLRGRKLVGVGKTELRVTPVQVADPEVVLEKCQTVSNSDIDLILAEDTGD